jgi:hypothetical protein
LYKKEVLSRTFRQELDPFEKPGGTTGKQMKLRQKSILQGDDQAEGSQQHEKARPKYIMGRRMSALNFTDVHQIAQQSNEGWGTKKKFQLRSSSPQNKESPIAIGQTGKTLYNHQTLDSKARLTTQASLCLDNFGSGHMDHR